MEVGSSSVVIIGERVVRKGFIAVSSADAKGREASFGVWGMETVRKVEVGDWSGLERRSAFLRAKSRARKLGM